MGSIASAATRPLPGFVLSMIRRRVEQGKDESAG